MKKLLYTTLIALAGIFAASCEQEHIEAIYNPQNVKAQTLGEIQGTTLSADGPAVTTTFNPVDFNLPVSATYSFYASANESFTEKNKMASTIEVKDGVGTISMTQKDLNSMVFALGGVADEPFTIFFKLYAYAANDKGSGVQSTEVTSNVVSANFTAFATDILDVDLYDHVWVIGASAAVGAWNFDNVHQYLYDYNKTGNTFSGVIDFGEEGPSGGFKLTGVGNWNDADKNWGSEAQAEEAEASSVTIIAGGGSKDIKCYSKRYYGFSFDSNAKILTKLFGFDNVGLVGSFNEWNPADDATKMTFNPYYHRFYIDYTFDADAEVKFTCDGAWDLNWGANGVAGGDNIAVSAGSYRIYLDLNTNTIDFSTSMFGKEEPGAGAQPEPEPVGYQGWGIIGSFNDWAGDAEMTESAGVWTGYVTLAADAEWKLRKDAGWDENVGGNFVALGEPFAAEAGGANIMLGKEGFFKVVYDTNAGTITVYDGEVWSLIGGFNDWAGDVDMTLTDGKWVSPATQISGEFKIRHNHAWDEDRGGTMNALGEPFDAVPGGANITVEDGLYKVTYDPENETITVEAGKPENLWAIIGSVMGTSWDTDLYMAQDGDLWVYEGLEVAEGDEFKIRFNNDWGINRGGVFAALGEAFEVLQDGSNISGVPAGTYNLTYNPAEETITIAEPLKGWSVIGDFNGWGDDAFMTEVLPGIWVSEALDLTANGWKIRYNKDWGVNRGATGLSKVGAFAKAVPDGDNITIEGKVQVVFNANAGTIGTLGWGIVGSIASIPGFSWNADVPMNLGSDGKWYSYPVTLTTADEFKLRYMADWGVNRGGECAEIGAEFAAAQDGANIKAPADGTYILVYDPATEAITLSTEFWGLIGGFNEWAGDAFMMCAGEGKWVSYGKTLPGEWKIRQGADWAVNRGGAFAESGTPFEAVPDGSNIVVGDETIDIVYDSVAETITVTK